MARDMDDKRPGPSLTAILSDPFCGTYAIVNKKGEAITADEIESQTNIQIPPTLEEFIFGGYSEQVGMVLDRLEFTHNIFNFHLLPPIARSFKIICLAFNYRDQDTWLRFGKFPPNEPVSFRYKTC